MKAVIWDYYKVVDDNEHFASCQTFNEQILRGGRTPKIYNTSNMIDHLQKKHPLIYKDYEEKKKLSLLQEQPTSGKKSKNQPTLMQTRLRLKLWDINDPKAECIHLKIAEMIVLDYQLLSVVSVRIHSAFVYN